MRYDIVLDREAETELRRLRANTRAAVRDALEKHLRREPTKTSRSRIKRLRGLRRPQYRLRVEDEIRVYYDVNEEDSCVEVIAILRKSETEAWLQAHGELDETDSPEPDEG